MSVSTFSRVISSNSNKLMKLSNNIAKSSIQQHAAKTISSTRININTNNTRSFSSMIVQHRPSPDNDPNMKWEFTKENMPKVERILAKFPSNYKASAVMPLLTLAQEQNDNWLPLAAMNKIAEMLEMPPIRVYEVATFYSMYNREKLGKYHLQVCGTTPCQLCGSEKLMDTLKNHLKIDQGETSADGLFTWNEVECLGACANAPMIQINNHEYYENLTSETIIKLVEDLRAGKQVKAGPQSGLQRVAEGPMGKTSLFEEPKPVVRDLDEVERNWKAEQEKAKAAAAAQKK